MDSDPIDLQTAADHMGVHYQTAYKWVRSGRLFAEVINGRYMLRRSTIAEFIELRNRPTTIRVKQSRMSNEQQADRMYLALVAGDERLARSLAENLMQADSITRLIENVLAPAVRRIGTEWHEGLLNIWVEHRASAIVERIIGGYHPTPRGRRRGTAVVAALSGDLHALATSMAATALRDDNWHVHHLGADMPSGDLLDFCTQTGVDLAVLTVTLPQMQSQAQDTAVLMQSQGVRTLVGRPGSTLTELQRLARGE